MKPTAALPPSASGPEPRAVAQAEPEGASAAARRVALSVIIVAAATLMFLLGRQSVTTPSEMDAALESLRLQLQTQQSLVDRLARDKRRDTNALAARLAELQAASTRLDALGERLAQMGQLSLDEFDFSAPPPVGGPEEYQTLGENDSDALHGAIEALGAKLRRQASQLDALQFLMVNRQLENDLTPSGWPLRKGWISSRYGERTDPFTGERSIHQGLDFSGTPGTDVLSVASGVVIWASSRAAYGKTVEIDHGNGYVTRYAHNRDITVKAGDHVTAGQVIAKLGSSGRASGPHLHFEVLKNGARVNPAGFVSQLR
jgi:murein DD-endopeptidase MepM/ murein hydrolase activator NlpD